MIVRLSKLPVALAALAWTLLLAPLSSPAAYAGAGAAAGSTSPSGCASCRSQPPARSDPDSACPKRQRVIDYVYPSGSLSWENCSRPPDSPLAPNAPVSVRVCCINPYRHAVNVKIQQQTFEELYQAPSLITGNLLPGTDKTQTKQAADEAKAPKPAGKGLAPTVAPQVVSLIDRLKDRLDQFNEAADRLTRLDGFVADQRARVLQIDDPTELARQSAAAESTLVRELTAPDPSPCGTGNCSPEALIQFHAKLSDLVDSDFTALTSVYNEAKQAKVVTVDFAELYTKAEKRHEALVSSRQQRDVQFASAISVYANILAPDFGCLLFGPVAATGDEVDIVVDTPLKDEAANFTLTPAAAPSAAGSGAGTTKPAPNASVEPALVIPVVGRHAPSFSTGIFFTNLVNPTFVKGSDNTVHQNRKDLFAPALGAMVHTPLLFPSPEVSIQLSLGVALKDSNPLYVLGPSVVLGRRQRTVITAGVAGTQVNRLTDLKVGDPVPASQSQPGTAKVFRLGYFVGLTYNFGPATQSGQTTPSTPSAKKK
jgi:hypothetical protein